MISQIAFGIGAICLGSALTVAIFLLLTGRRSRTNYLLIPRFIEIVTTLFIVLYLNIELLGYPSFLISPEIWVELLGVIAISCSTLVIIALTWYFLRRIFFNQKLNKSKKQYPGLPIINIMHQKKFIYLELAIIYMGLAILVHILLSQIYGIQRNIFIIIALFSAVVIIYLNRLIWEYRINQGIYANNRRETEEIIHFILDDSPNIDFTDGGKPKRIMSDQDITEIRERIVGKLSGNLISA